MRRVFLCLLLLPAAGCFNGVTLVPAQVGSPVEENLVTPASGWLCRDKVALIDVEGVILNARTGGLLGGGDNPVSLFSERLDAAANDKHVKAVVLRINSPGGGVTASDILYRELVRFREETHKPVVACMMDTAASGGYYLAMGCDRVYAHPSTVTGSIGVIMSLYNASDLMQKVGLKTDPIKSGPNKDIGNPGRPMTEQERAILQGIVNGFYEQFVGVVAKARAEHLRPEKVRELADGRVYTGVEAKQLGLVDEVGYLEDALRCAKDMACVKDACVVAYDNNSCGYRGSIFAAAPNIPRQINVKLDLPGLSAIGATAGLGGNGFYYLWEPGLAR
jgi:protease-4